MIGERARHFVGRLEISFGVGDFFGGDARQERAGADGIEDAVVQEFLGAEEMNAICRDKGHTKLAAEFFGGAEIGPAAGREVMNREVESISENILELASGFCGRGIFLRRVKRNQAAAMRVEQLERERMLIVLGIELAARDEFAEAAVTIAVSGEEEKRPCVRFEPRAENGLYARFARGLIERQSSVKAVRVRERDGGHFLGGCGADDLFGRGHSPKEGILAATIKMNEHGWAGSG